MDARTLTREFLALVALGLFTAFIFVASIAVETHMHGVAQ